jgi:SpoVK/Ycf46/Vps4 family AAA+-type ATPase
MSGPSDDTTSREAGAEFRRNADYLRAEVHRLIALAKARQGGDPDVPDAVASLRKARDVLASARTGEPDQPSVPLHDLVVRFGLEPLETDLLLAAMGPLLDADLGTAYRDLRGTVLMDGVDVALVLRITCDDWQESLRGRKALSPGAPLLTSGLLTPVLPRGSGNPLKCELRVSPSAVNHVVGNPSLPECLGAFCEIVKGWTPLDSFVLAQPLKDALRSVMRPWKRWPGCLRHWGYPDEAEWTSRAILLSGASGTGKTALAASLAAEIGSPLLRVCCDRLPEDMALSQLFADLRVESVLRNAVVCLDDCDAVLSTRAGAPGFLSFIETFAGLLLLTAREPQSLDPALASRVLFHARIAAPDVRMREDLWERFLQPEVQVDEQVDLHELAGKYEFNGASIRNAVKVALSHLVPQRGEPVRLTMTVLRDAADAQLRTDHDASRAADGACLGLGDVILPEPQSRQLAEVLNACRNHAFVMNRWGFGARLPTGRGIAVLFDGPPGTGKTLCAEVLARELGRPLQRVNIPSVVSKWVGETERHIQDLFARARAAHAMLLFDEADALFARRVAEPSSANDRYANMEVNLLLQEVERFDGVVLLTTNSFGSLDEALRRRIAFRITFPAPAAAERARIWRALIPAQVPLTPDIDFTELGHAFELSGGTIKNAVLRAAFAAADDGGFIGMRHLREAAAAECRAAGVLFREGVGTGSSGPRVVQGR